jgi:hypothetical protein
MWWHFAFHKGLGLTIQGLLIHQCVQLVEKSSIYFGWFEHFSDICTPKSGNGCKMSAEKGAFITIVKF